ncbi:MAG: polynucleotide adenylyltransferase PcnB [Chlamydiia bacterium]|nr:polynucleotide adenylyltransferase PcnB [Chlamydiia bacterium]
MEPKIFYSEEHGIDHGLIDPDALFILSKLRDAGYTAYLVGGSVRDILTKNQPKDFDISTSALPEEIKSVFKRNCLLIGRRFRLAHIRFGRKVFEVSTFRAGNIEEEELIVRDNEWGTAEEDASRRDFSINGLFYDPHHGALIDYVDGWEDIRSGIIRSIGNPHRRFKQDPVRMIRLLKFHARFGFGIHPDCIEALTACREEINKSAPARVLEELLRMLESGHSKQFFMLLSEHNLLDHLIPDLDAFLRGPHGSVIYKYLEIIDLIHEKNPDIKLQRSILISALLFPIMEYQLQTEYLDKGVTPNLGQISILAWSVIRGIMTTGFTHFPKKLSSQVAYILTTQYRLTPIGQKKSHRTRFLQDHDCKYALRFLKVRTLVDSSLKEDYFHWEKLFKKVEPLPPEPEEESRRSRGPRRSNRGRYARRSRRH